MSGETPAFGPLCHYLDFAAWSPPTMCRRLVVFRRSLLPKPPAWRRVSIWGTGPLWSNWRHTGQCSHFLTAGGPTERIRGSLERCPYVKRLRAIVHFYDRWSSIFRQRGTPVM